MPIASPDPPGFFVGARNFIAKTYDSVLIVIMR